MILVTGGTGLVGSHLIWHLLQKGEKVLYHVSPNEKLRARQERDNISYSPLTMVIPAGIGVNIGIRNFIDLGFEIGGRYAFNDYLDGFTSPTSTANDIYYISSFVLVYRIRNRDFILDGD